MGPDTVKYQWYFEKDTYKKYAADWMTIIHGIFTLYVQKYY